MVAASSSLPPIYYIRHGETDWNRNGLIQGESDTELNALGHQQAAQLAEALRAHQPELRNYNFFVSPQKRAQATMRVIATAQGRDPASITIDPRLRELSFGVWETKQLSLMRASRGYPHDPRDHYHWRPEGGESYADGRLRIEDFLAELKSPAFIVSHGALGRCLMGHVAGLPPERICELPIPQGHYCKLESGIIQWFDCNHAPV